MYPSRHVSRQASHPQGLRGIGNARLHRRPSAEKLVYGFEGNNPAQVPEKHLKATSIFRARVHHIDLDIARASGRERSAKQPARRIVSFAQRQSDDHYAVARLKSLLGLKPELPHGATPQGILGKRRRNNDGCPRDANGETLPP